MNTAEENLKRRQWLVGLGRNLILGGISMLSINLLSRRLNAGCIRPGSPCQSCGVYTQCGLPRAKQTKRSPAGRRA